MIVERPFLTKQEILRAYDPAGRASDAAFKRLRREGVVSAGVTIRPRRSGRIAGRLTAYSALNRDAAVAYRKDRASLARRIAKAAARVEQSSNARRFALLATEGSPDEAQPTLHSVVCHVASLDRSVVDDLARKTLRLREDDLANALTETGVTLVLGVVARILDQSAELQASDGLSYSVPVSELATRGLAHQGEPVAVWMEGLGEGGLFTVLEPAWADDEETVWNAQSDRPFDEDRPPLPEDLDQRLDDVLGHARPVALTGPALPRATH
jgi:hypothetical protein